MKPNQIVWQLRDAGDGYKSQRLVRISDKYHCCVYKQPDGLFNIVGPGAYSEDRRGLDNFLLMAELIDYEPEVTHK